MYVLLFLNRRRGNKVAEKKGVEVGGGCVWIIPVACPDKLVLFARRNMG
jgi:hypothetical protein